MEVRWLDDEEQEAWRWFVTAMTILERQLDKDLRDAHGLTHDDYGILALLSHQADRRLRLSVLADALRLTRPNLTHRIKRLESMGAVLRARDPDDGRGAWAVLTDVGFDRLADAAPTHVTGVREYVLDPLERDEFLALGRAARKIVEANSKVPAELMAVRT